MNYSFDILLDELSCCEQGIYPVKRPNMPSAKRKYEKHDIKGRDGELIVLSDNYYDVVISIEFNYLSKDKNKWHQCYRDFKRFLKNKKTLHFSDDPNYFHYIKMIEIEENDRTSVKIGRFTVNFTVEPFYYLKEGLSPLTLEADTTISNSFEQSLPIYHLTGEGYTTLSVNGYEMQCNVSEELYIDTKLKIAYKSDGSNANTTVSGDYDSMILEEGENVISISNDINLSIIPNWRCLM